MATKEDLNSILLRLEKVTQEAQSLTYDSVTASYASYDNFLDIVREIGEGLVNLSQRLRDELEEEFSH